MSVTTANRDFTLLHPVMRDKAQRVLDTLIAEGVPFRVFEAWRSPERQAYLYAQGRTRPGRVVTFARSWQSYHQYGLAADFVLYRDGQWSWDDSGAAAAWWRRLHEVGAAHGLERLGFETPHLQVADLQIGSLMDGDLPDGGDESWRHNLAEAAAGWNGTPPAPPMPPHEATRPPLPLAGALDWSTTPQVGSSQWHSQFNGQEWRHDEAGVYLRAAPNTPLRSPGAPTTAQAIMSGYAAEIHASAMHHQIPPESIVMTIAAESAAQRQQNFTGPSTFRWEAHVEVTDVNPHTFGDYSAGPMQTLATTAREVIRNAGLNYQPLVVAPYYAHRPQPAPANNPLYGGAANIDIGTAEIKMRLNKSGIDPILVAACFNAGGLYQSQQNSWHLRTNGNHLDRAAQWFGDACFVLGALRQP